MHSWWFRVENIDTYPYQEIFSLFNLNLFKKQSETNIKDFIHIGDMVVLFFL